MADFQCFRDFIFMNGSAKSSVLQWVVRFFRGVKFHEWSTSAKFAEFTYLEKNQLYGTHTHVCTHTHTHTTHTHAHAYTHTHTTHTLCILSITIHTYVCVCVCLCVCEYMHLHMYFGLCISHLQTNSPFA